MGKLKENMFIPLPVRTADGRYIIVLFIVKKVEKYLPIALEILIHLRGDYMVA